MIPPPLWSILFTVVQTLSRPDAALLMDEVILPTHLYGDRLAASGKPKTDVVRPDDPVLEQAYAEFPLESFDVLLDEACRFIDDDAVTCLDLGSGCGRLCLYLSLTRPCWKVKGVELVDDLHQQALQAVKRSPEHWNEDDGDDLLLTCSNVLQEPLPACNLLFCYATALSTSRFDPSIGAMILAWSERLTQVCRPGTIAVTTDRALDPEMGWQQLCPPMEVPNPSLMGSVGYIQRLVG